MIEASVVAFSVGLFVVGVFIGVLVRDVAGSEGAVKRWIELRHEFRMKALAQRERWLEVDPARPRPGETRAP